LNILLIHRPPVDMIRATTLRGDSMPSPKYRLISLFILSLLFFVPIGCDCGDDDDDNDDASDDDSADDDADDDNDDDTDDNTDDDDPTPEYLALIAEGKDWLAFPEGDKARQSFMQALEIDPDGIDAMYGLVLANTVHNTDVLSILVDYVMSVIDYGGPVKADDFSGDDLINGILQGLLDGLVRDRTYELLDYADRTLSASGTFQHDGIPIFIHYEQVAQLGGEFDKGELYATKAFSGIFSAIVYQMYALDLDFDIFNAYQLAIIDFDVMSTEEIIGLVVDILLDILKDPSFPDFLTVTASGAIMFQEAGMELGDGFDAWTKVFESIDLESDDQLDDVMGYDDANGNFARDAGENYIIPHYGLLDESQMELLEAANLIAAAFRDTYYDYTEKDVDPDNPNPFPVKLFKPVARHFGVPAFIIPDMYIDIGSWFVDPEGSGFKESLISILEIADIFLP
jgi:hypothetical protein